MAGPTVETLNKPIRAFLLYGLIISTPRNRQLLDFGNTDVIGIGRFNFEKLTHRIPIVPEHD